MFLEFVKAGIFPLVKRVLSAKRKMYGKSSKLNFGVFFIDFNERLD